MARISDMNGRIDGAYSRLFGDNRLGHLSSQVHAASIRAGIELEKFLIESIPKQNKNKLRNIFEGKIINPKKEITIKPTMPRAGEKTGIISDFAIFYHTERHFYVVELKDGDQFDTQKSPTIKANLQLITNFISQKTFYRGDFCICSFNQQTKVEIITGFKYVFSETQIFTGPELCSHLGVDYNSVLAFKKADQDANRKYLFNMIDLIKAQIDDQTYLDSIGELQTGQLRLFKGIG